MEPVTIAMLASAAVSAGTGVYQSMKAKKMADQSQRPTYEVPEEMKAAMSDAERLALEGLPQEQKQQYVENIQRANQSALRAQSDRKGGLAGIGAMHQNELDQYRNLLAMDAQARRQNQQNLQGMRGKMATIRDQEFKINKYNPYLQEQQDIRDIQAAGMQNIMTGVQQSISGLGAANQGASQVSQLEKILKELKGDGSSTNGTIHTGPGDVTPAVSPSAPTTVSNQQNPILNLDMTDVTGLTPAGSKGELDINALNANQYSWNNPFLNR